jgi:hypothetical protein
MGSSLAPVLPLALGAAISPTLLALQLLILSGTTHRLARAWALVAGSALVLAAFCVLCLTALARAQSGHGHKSATDATVLIGSGVLLGALAVRSRIRRPTAGEQHTSRISQRLATASSAWFVGVGAVGMVVNFSTLLLVLPAVHEIVRSDADSTAKAVTFVVMYVIVLLPVLVPVVLAQALGSRADHALDATHRWVGRNARTIGTVIEAVFAVYLVVKGVRAAP